MGKHCIQSFHRMTFTHYEPVPVRVVLIFRIYIHLFIIKLNKDIHTGHIASDMTSLSGHYDIHTVLSEIKGHSL